MTSIFEGQPPKQGLFQSKQWLFGFQVYLYILYINLSRTYLVSTNVSPVSGTNESPRLVHVSFYKECEAVRRFQKTSQTPKVEIVKKHDADSRIVAPSLFGTHTTSAPDTVCFWSAGLTPPKRPRLAVLCPKVDLNKSSSSLTGTPLRQYLRVYLLGFGFETFWNHL